MAYLNSPTLVFTGDFQSDVSTVNNDVRHYDNKTFIKRYQLPEESEKKILNGWWNPDGGAAFRWVDCKIVQCIDAKGEIEVKDSLLDAQITGIDDLTSGKMVDLDPQMQTTSQLWGVSIQIKDTVGRVLLQGTIKATGFRDLMNRQYPNPGEQGNDYARNGQPLGGSWYSVLEDLKWGEDADLHPTLKTLRATTEENKLSISIKGYGFYYAHADGRFSQGRTIGTIGPWKKVEPKLFAPTRRLYGIYNLTAPNPTAPFFNYTNYIVENGKLRIDFGMSFPINGPLGNLNKKFFGKELIIAIAKDDIDTPTNTGTKQYVKPWQYERVGILKPDDEEHWLAKTGGLVQFDLTAEQEILIASNQLLLLLNESSRYQVLAREGVDGWYVRADENVFRIDPGDKPTGTYFYVYQWGKPAKGKQIQLTHQTKQPGGGGSGPGYKDQPPAKIPDTCFPEGKMFTSGTGLTDENGRTSVVLFGLDPGRPRGYISGQMYYINYGIVGVSNLMQYFLDWLIIHLRSDFPAFKDTNPTWDDVKEVWIQFANLYPIMSKFLIDLSLPQALLKRKEILKFAMSLPIEDPNYMPVTRDMSKNTVHALLKWLDTASPDEDFNMDLPEVAEVEDSTQGGADTIVEIASQLKSGNKDYLNKLFFDSIDMDEAL